MPMLLTKIFYQILCDSAWQHARNCASYMAGHRARYRVTIRPIEALQLCFKMLILEASQLEAPNLFNSGCGKSSGARQIRELRLASAATIAATTHRFSSQKTTFTPRALERNENSPWAHRALTTKEIRLGVMRACVGRKGGPRLRSRASSCGASQANGYRPFCPR